MDTGFWRSFFFQPGRFSRRQRLWLGAFLLATIASLLTAACTGAGQDPEPPSAADSSRSEPLPTTLQHIVATTTPAKLQLQNGTEGSFLVRFSVAGKQAKDGSAVRWRLGGQPTVVRLRASEESEITFLSGQSEIGKNGAAGARAVVLELEVPKEGDELVHEVKYAVGSRARVKNYTIGLSLSAPLTAGDKTYDSGVVTVPVRVETPLQTKIIVLCIIAIAIFLFVVEWVRVDVVAIMMMLSLPLLNLLHSKQTFNGLSSNAVIAIIGVMIVSAGLNKVGLVSRVVKPVIRLAGKSSTRLMIFLSSLIAIISSVMQNTGAAVLFLPGIRHACKVIKVPVSRILMPIGMCAILGGTLTMIGTSPLILLNDILPEGMEKFSLLELTPIGLGFVIGGIIYFSTLGRVFLAQVVKAQLARRGLSEGDVTDSAEGEEQTVYHDLAGPFEVQVPADYHPKKSFSTVVETRREHGVNIVSLADEHGQKQLAPSPELKIMPGYTLCVYGLKDKVQAFVEEFGLVLRERPRVFTELFNPAVAGTVEAVVTPRSQMIGSTIQEIGLRKHHGVATLAVYREGKTYYKELSDVPLMSGDAILMHSTWEHFHELQEAHRNFRIITPLEVEIQKPAKAGVAVICFGLAMTLMLVSSFYFQKLPYNPIPLSVCLMLGAVGMVLTGVISIREAYQAVDWRTVFLLGGLIPLGMAVDRTGTAEWIATGVVTALGESVTPLVLIIVLAVMSGCFCLVISNVGACTLLVPLGASMATQIGIDPRVAAVVVGLGVSNSFLLPTHQVNALYMGPGDYRTKDYMKIGGIMSLLYVTVLSTMTYLFYL